MSYTPKGGHWSYLGVDIREVDPVLPTMNLDSFTMGTPESELIRVLLGRAAGKLGVKMRSELVTFFEASARCSASKR